VIDIITYFDHITGPTQLRLGVSNYLSIGGPPPGFPQKEHFLCGTSSEKASREGPNIQRKTARRFPRIGDGTLTRCHGGPRPALELHPLKRGNRYMSRRYRVTHTNARAVTLADFGFALILPRNSHAAPPIEDEFSPPRVVRTAIAPSSRVPPEPAWHQSFP
jgi:hypothetical protein